MSFASHYNSLLQNLRLPALAVVVLMAGAYWALYVHLPASSHPDEIEISHQLPEWPVPPETLDVDWSLFRNSEANVSIGQPAFAADFRFAGTFFLNVNGRETRKAVVGIVQDEREVIVSEGSEINGVTVSRIFPDRLILRQGDEVAELKLSFSTGEGSLTESSGADSAAAAESVSPYGEKVGNDSWVLSRKSLLDYYQELLDAPERLLQVFDSLKPLYNETGKIDGYRLGVEGEQQFFDGVGFREGDVVRKVNSLDMTSRNRAEFFIKQVVDSRLSAIVIDIERDGTPRRLVYRVR